MPQGIISALSDDTFHNYIGRNVTMLGHRADVVSLLELMLLYMHCFCCVRDCCVVAVRHLTFVERVASSKHKLSLSLPADDNTIGRLLLILDVGANAGLNKDEVLLAIGSVSS